jgi:Cep192 domain 4
LIRYQPTVVATDSGQIQINFDSGTPVTVNLQGNGVSPMFTYNLLQGDQVTPVTPPGPIPLPDTNVGDKSSVVIQVKNSGNTTGTISNPPSLAGTAYQISGLPLFPQVLKPNESFTFTLTFTPAQPGDLPGQLLVGSDLLTISGRGLGPKLVFSYVSGGTSTTLGPTDAVIFSPIAVGQTSQLDFTITNMGTTTAKVSNIVIGEAKSPFSLVVLPNLPASLDPGQTLQFSIAFAPIATGPANGTLHIDTTVIQMIGSGTPPPPLPTYTIQGPSGNVDAQSQPAIRLTLANPYPLALTGVLTLNTSSDLVNDPAVQFSTGGRTVPFVIPANSTAANFAGQGPQLRLQTGTVASSITLTPTFATQSGGIDVTPASPTTLQFAVAAAQPVLVSIQAGSETASSFTLTVTGYSTTRTLTGLTLQFTPAAGISIGTSQLTSDLKQTATSWFQSTASQAFGGQFSVTVPFTLQGTPPTGETLLQTIAAISATVSSERGTSNSLQVTLP